MFDMGPYYLTALVNLLGPIRRVTGSTRMTFPERTATSEALYGQKLPVEVKTHVGGVVSIDIAIYRDGTLEPTQIELLGQLRPAIERYHAALDNRQPIPVGNVACYGRGKLLTLDGGGQGTASAAAEAGKTPGRNTLTECSSLRAFA